MIDEVERGVDPRSLVEVTWDPEWAAWRAPGSSHAIVRGRLSDGGVRVADEIRAPAAIGDLRVPELRWYQAEAVDEWRASGDRGVVALPTGSGKTIVAVAAMAALGVATLVLVPTRVLLDQWVRAVGACWPHAIGKLGDGDQSVKPITIATYASAIAWAPRIGDRFGLVVVDEAHHVGAWCPVDMLEMFVAPARLGLTATPPGPGPLGRHVGPIVYTLSIDDLVGDGLAELDVVTLRLELTADERARYDRDRGSFAAAYASFVRRVPGAAWKQFVDASARSETGRAAMAAWKASRAVIAYPGAKRAALRQILATHAGERTLVFTGDNPTAYAIARELLVVPITHEIGRAERMEVIERFRAGDAPVLVSSQVLDEGFDVPDADVAIVVGGSASARRHVQRIGRVLRPRPGKRARVYEMVVGASVEVAQLHARHAEVAS